MTTSITGRTNSETNIAGSRVPSGVTYFLIGSGIGAALALLFAPKKGADLRNDISDITRKGYDETLELANQIKEHSAEALNAIKDKTSKVYDLASAKLSLAREAADRSIDEAASAVDVTLSEAAK